MKENGQVDGGCFLPMSDKYAVFLKKRWVCMIACLFICICAGFGYAWSVLQMPIILAHDWPDSQVSLTYTIMVLCSTMAPLIFGALIRRLGVKKCVIVGSVLYGVGLICSGVMQSVWQFYLFYGILAGLGVGFVYPTVMAYVVKLFPDRAGMASGLATAAYGSGAILWAPVTVGIINSLSIHLAFVILGIAFLVMILVGALLLKEPPEGFAEHFAAAGANGSESGGGDGLCRKEMVRTGAFYLMVVLFTCGLVAGVIVISQASPILQNAFGYTAAGAAALVSVISACNMVGRFFWGSVSDRIGLFRTAVWVFAICIVSMATLSVLSATVPGVAAMCVAATCYGGFASILTPMTAQKFGTKYVSENYGVMYIVFGLASLIGPVLAVQFKTVAGSYTGAFAAAAGFAVVGLILSFVLQSKKFAVLKQK